MSLCIAVFVHTVMKFSISGWGMMVVEGYTPRSIGRCCVTTLFPYCGLCCTCPATTMSPRPLHSLR